MPTTFNTKRVVFMLVTVLCLAVAVAYTWFSARKEQRAYDQPSLQEVRPAQSQTPASLPSQTAAEKPSEHVANQRSALSAHKATADKTSTPGHTRPRLVALNMRESPDLGKVEFAPLENVADNRTPVDLRCERIYFAAERGICLRREVHILTAQTVATIVDANFQPQFTVRNDGIPSRTRVSPDGRYAAFTVFLTGHSYGDAQLSTATVLVDLEHGASIGNLEQFQVLQDGKVIKAPDFNYWGVTFQRDSNFFYATLRTGGVNYLVHGDIKARTITVIYKGVECPSLSPDGKRIAFKKLISRNNWRLTVLDLATLQETPLAETKSVDDQAEWLDNHHVLYAMVDAAPWMSIMVVPSDGSGQPQVFAKGATSPAIVR